MEKFILAISREYGSCGRKIGEAVAKNLGVQYYDKSIIHMVAEKSGMSAEFIEKSAADTPNAFLFNLKYSAYSPLDSTVYYDTPITDKVFITQTAVIRELAAEDSCVIVGRCADYILREEPGLVSVFIRGDIEDRIKYAVANYDLPADKAAERIKKIDKNRANYYKHYTHRQWGSILNYDLVINTSYTGVNGAVAVILTMLREKGVV